ncbi:hypothetical protein KIS4809_1125 [Bacillus sp. ZZV12-4809]|nr:hypothetical protein KIS4809_1125 [Bacillus sp. ZZV12-4809]
MIFAAWLGKLIQCPAEGDGSVRPCRLAEEARMPPRGFAACLEKKSTGKIKRDFV